VTGPAPDFATATVPLTGMVSGPNPLQLASSTTDLGSIAVGSTGSPVTFTLSYSGCPGDVMGPFTSTLTSAEFIVTGETCSASVFTGAGTCAVSVALRPTSAGAKSATLSVAAMDGKPAVATVTGTGLAIDAAVVDAPATDTSIVAAGGLDAGSDAR
jgi:hypothetical protein